MHRRDLDAFVSRGWAEAARQKDVFWRSWSAEESLRISDELRRSASELRPDWPSAAERDADLACHARVADFLRRVHANRKR
jgi:hypothetical protein